MRHLFVFAILLLSIDCAVFRTGDQTTSGISFPNPVFGAVTYEFVNWESEGNEAQTIVIESLNASGAFTSLAEGVDGDYYMQICLDKMPGEKVATHELETSPGSWALSIGNRYIFGQTFFLFPLIRRVDRNISFRVWQGGRLQKVYSYRSDMRIFIGWLTLLASPWSESTAVKRDYTRVVKLFLADAKGDAVYVAY